MCALTERVCRICCVCVYVYVCVCVCVCVCECVRLSHLLAYRRSSVNSRYTCKKYRVAKTQRMPYVAGHFLQKSH